MGKSCRAIDRCELMKSARILCPAKLTLSLQIKGQRDDGFHFIDAEMVSIDLFDELFLGAGSGFIIRGQKAGLDIPIDDNNLVNKALAFVGKSAKVEIDKQIPAGAGLGGGSTNAAGILRWAGFKDSVAAAELGSDVSFCLAGGRARVTGVGELVEPLPYLEKELTLLVPPIGVSTPRVYEEWDAMGSPKGGNGNDLEPAALRVEPRLADWRDALTEFTGKRARLAGSGGTWFVEGTYEKFVYRGASSITVRTLRPESAI